MSGINDTKIAIVLPTMMGKSYKFRHKVYHLLDYYDDGKFLYIKTNQETLKFDIDYFVKIYEVQFKEYDSEETTDLVNYDNGQIVLAEKYKTKGIVNILLDNIQKLEGDPNYIKQADAINRATNSIINIAKLELQILQANNKLNK